MVEGRWFAQEDDLTQPLAIRRAVFGRGRDALDALARQVVVYGGGVPVGTARLWWADGAFWMGDVGVLSAERGKGYGDLLVRLVLYKAVSHAAAYVCLDCPRSLEPFFARYGFAPTEEAQGDTLTLRVSADAMNGCAHCGHAAP